MAPLFFPSTHSWDYVPWETLYSRLLWHFLKKCVISYFNSFCKHTKVFQDILFITFSWHVLDLKFCIVIINFLESDPGLVLKRTTWLKLVLPIGLLPWRPIVPILEGQTQLVTQSWPTMVTTPTRFGDIYIYLVLPFKDVSNPINNPQQKSKIYKHFVIH